MADSCLFCRIVNKEIPSEVIYEDDAALAILDVHPLAEGHVLVLPKRHAYAILDVSDEDMGPVFRAVKRVVALLDGRLRPDGFTIGINQRGTAGQTAEHLHVHVIPRWKDDGGGSLHSVVHRPPKVPLAEVARMIVSPKEQS